MAISLGDVKRGVKVKRLDEEELTTTVASQPTTSSGIQTINLKDIREGKASLKPLGESQASTNNTTTTVAANVDGYTDTGKKVGDYTYWDFSTRGQYKIYSKDGGYYYYDEKNSKYRPFINETRMTTKELDEQEYNNAVAAGYKGQRDTLKMLDRLKLDTSNLSEKEYKDYEKDLQRQQDKKDEELNYVRTGGAGIKGTLGEIKNATKNVKENAVEPISRIPENYKMGKLSEKTSLEAYKYMQGEENNYEQAKQKLDNYMKFNSDIVNSNTMLDDHMRSMPTQIGGLWSGVKSGGIGGVVGGLIGGTIGAVTTKTPEGTIAGAKIGANWGSKGGYVAGQTQYTYELEAGAQYQTLIEMGVPEDIAREEAKKVGTVNALIESGESILDLITLGKTSAATEKLKDSLIKKYGKEVVEGWVRSRVSNIASEGIEEGLQEFSSIQGEKRAAERAGIERDSSGDTQRVLDSAKAGAFGGLLSAGGAGMVNLGVNKVINNANVTQQQAQNAPQTIAKDVNTLNLGQNRSVEGKISVSNANVQNDINITNNSKKDSFKQVINPDWSDTRKQIYNQVIKSKILNNTKQAHQFVEFVANVAEYTGVNITIQNNQTLAQKYKQLQNKGVDTKNIIINGFNDKNGITINADSQRALNVILGHETAHLFENVKAYDTLQKFAIEYAKTKKDYAQRLATLKKNYQGIDANLTRELVADIIGDYLFTDQQFVNTLRTKNYNAFQKVYDFVKHIYKMATAGSKEARQLEQLKYMLDVANSQARKTNTENNGVKFSIQEKNGSKYVKVDTDQNIFEGVDPKDYNKIAKMYIEDYLLGETTLATNDYAEITKKTAKKYTNPGYNQANFQEKMKLTPELKNVLKIATKVEESAPTKENSKFQKWEYYKFDFMIDGKMFEGTINIGVTDGNKYLYEINKIHEKKTSELGTSLDTTTGLRANNIPQSNKKVKSDISTNYSTQKNKDNSKYSIERTDNKDNQGRTLTKAQQKFFKDSKARDKDGNLVTVYHTTTEEGYQFNEFNPVGTDYYKFGDQVVNYFTDDKQMSGSYANQNYVMADTKKLTSMKQVEKYINDMNKKGWGSDRKYELITENGKFKLIDNSNVPNTNKTWQQVYDEANKYKNTLSDKELKQFKDMFEKSSEYDNDGIYNIDNYLMRNGYEFGSEQDRIAQKYLNIDKKNYTERGIYFDAIMRDAKYHTIGSFENENELFRNLKSEGQALAKRQYEGYVNITNPYIIDAEGRNWNRIESKKDSPTTEKMIYLDGLTKDRLIQLATDSKNRYEKNYSEYRKWLDATNSIDGNLRDENNLQIRSANRIFREVYADGVKAFINKEYKSPMENGNDSSLNSLYEWRTNSDIMTKMVDWDLITQAEYEEFNKSLQVPEHIRKTLKDLANTKVKYNEYDVEGRNPVLKEGTLLDIWEKYQEASKIYFNEGRYDYSIFDDQLLSGYLSEELKGSFPIRDEFGVNEDYLKDLFKVASHNFDENYIRSQYNEWSVTNDIVKKILELNKFGENYDGVIIKNTVDYGGRSEKHEAHDLYVTFNSNQFKAHDNTKPTNDTDIRYSMSKQNDKTTQNGDFNIYGKDVVLEKNQNLTTTEQNRLRELRALDEIGALNDDETQELEKLENKYRGKVKFANLKTNNTFEDIKKNYYKYQNLDKFDPKIVVKAKAAIKANNQGRRTKQEWLDVAKNIGSQLENKTSQEVEKYAIESWRYNKPNSKENLNRQGKKFVKFSPDEWVNAVYEGAKVGKVLNPLEIANLTPEDANTTPQLGNIKVETGKGKSSFYNNLTNKTKMLTEENRMKLSEETDVEFYKEVTNQDSLDKAFQKLNDNGASETLNWLSKKPNEATAVDIAEGWILLKQYQDAKDYDSMVQVAKKMREMGTKAGQTVQAFNIMSRLTPEGMVKYAQSELTEAYNAMVKNKTKQWIDKNASKFDLTPEETQFIIDTMKEVSTMEDGYDKRVKLAEIQKMLQDKLPPEKGAGIKAWMRISMLFNPKTQVRNIMGNAVITPVNALSDTFSALVDRQIAKKTGVRTTGNINVRKYAKGFKEGLYQSYNDFKKGINTRNMQGNRFEIGEGKSFKDTNVLGKSLNKVDSILNFALDAGDRPFYEAAFTNSINNQLVLNNTTEVTQEMIDIATQEALSRTWQDNNGYTKMVLDIRRNLNKLNVGSYGLGDVLIPFAKTPANLTKAIVEYSPVGLVTSLVEGNKLKNSIETGQYTAQQQHKFVQNLGKATAGTMLYILGYALAKAGITSGESDEDKDVADFMKNTLGIQSYSIKIGNKTFTYDWAQPIAAPFAITADYINNTNEDAKLHEKILSAIDTGLNLIFQQSFMSSIQNVLTNWEGLVSGLIEQILDLPSRATPTFLKQINDLIDGTTRISFEKGKPVKTAVNKVKSKVPGLSFNLAPSRDTLGRENKKYGGDNNPFNVFLNPANANKGKESESAKEIYRVYQETGNKDVMPKVAPYTIKLNGESKTLTAAERSEFQKISGEIIEENVKKLPSNSKYKKMSDEDKAEVINGIVDFAYNKAKSEILDAEVSKIYKTADKYVENGGMLYNFYASKVYKNRD